ncbi:MAG: FHA domain-containing protein [Anaerolineae bacterium]
MSQDAVLLALRLMAATVLLSFFGVALWLIWRDFRAASAEVDTRTQRRGRLVVLSAESDQLAIGKVYALMPLTSLGRSPANSVIIDDTYASSEHALITLRDGRWWLEDRHSSNGTLLNGYKIEEAVVLSSGDVIEVGRVAMKIELE